MDVSALPPFSPATLAQLAFTIGGLFGFATERSRFCTMGALSDILLMGDWTRLRMWALAAAVAIGGSTWLQLTGVIDVHDTIYTAPQLRWLSHLGGGLLFGIGMTLASGCGARTLVRLASGNLKALVVFVFLGLSSYMSLHGLFAVWRIRWLDSVAIILPDAQDLPTLLANRYTLDAVSARLACAGVIGGSLAFFALSSRNLWQGSRLLASLGIGSCIIAGWYLSGHLGWLPEDPETLAPAFLATDSGRMESLSFVAPFAYSLELLMRWTDSSRTVTLGIASLLGTLAGAGLSAITAHRFHIESFRDAPDLLRHIVGAVLMGFGGVTALGCTIGQGLSGLSTLSLGAMLTLAGIVSGALLTIKIQLQTG